MGRWFSRKPVCVRPASRSFQPTLEALEDRVVPTLSAAGPLSISSASDGATNPATAVALNANNQSVAIVVWTELNNNGDTDIKAKISVGGAAFGNAFDVANSSANEDHADVAINKKGDFVIVWESDANNSNVNYALFRNGFQNAFIEGSVADTSRQEVSPQVGLDSKGHFVVAYQTSNESLTNSSGQVVSSSTVRARLYDSNGNENAMIRVGVNPAMNNSSPQISMNAGSKFAISYVQAGITNSTTNRVLIDKNYTLNGDTGATLKGTFKIFSATGNQLIGGQDVAMDSAGNVLVVFNTQKQDGTQIINGRRINSGKLSSTTTFVTENTGLDVGFPIDPGTAVTLAMNATGGHFALTFDSTDPSTGDSRAIVQEFGTAPSTKPPNTAAPQILATSSSGSASSKAAISIDSANNYFVAYQSDANSGDVDAQFGNLF